MGYNNEARAKVYYCKPGSSMGVDNRLVPAPQMSITPEIYYANDTVIGYTYTIKLDGYANALRLDKNDRPSGVLSSGIEQTFSHMNDIRKIFNGNGGILYLVDNGGKTVLKAKGATIKSIQFNESDNQWLNFSPYIIEIEFNELDFLGCSNNAQILCNGSFFHTDQSTNVTSDNLVDFTKYKLKSFTDSWTFNITDEIYSQHSFNVTYNINATGKNYYDASGKLIPAWLQAKNFAQDRLYTQVKRLIDGAVALSNTSNNSCSPSSAPGQLYGPAASSGGLLKDFDSQYHIYNETISCDTSESEGSFSVTYNAIISAQTPSAGENDNAIHTHTQSISINDSGSEYSATLSVQGSVKGMIRGGIIDYSGNDFVLPQSGTFITKYNGTTTKYENAINSYRYYIGTNTDLHNSFKNEKNITLDALLIQGNTSPIPSSFSLEHSYQDGTVNYSAQYDTKLNRGLLFGFINMNITKNASVPIINEFVIPGRSQGPLIQYLGAKTARTISVSIEGALYDNKSCSIDLDYICNAIPGAYSIVSQLQSLESTGLWIATSKQYNKNQIDGSFSINIDYIATND